MLISNTQPPQLSSSDNSHLLQFYHRIRSMQISGIPCDLNRYIVGIDVRETLYWRLNAEGVLDHPDEFDAMLENVNV